MIRVGGIETEYGVTVPGNPAVNPITTSSLVVTSYANGEPGLRGSRRWDFDDEAPGRDARGYAVTDAYRGAIDAPVNDEESGMANVILSNGARLYVDHAHPEYSAPETTTPRDAVLWDKAGEIVMARAIERAARIPNSPPVVLYKNNTDNKGASYGTHENYLMKRQTAFAEIVRWFTPFLVSRQVVVGSGRVGIGSDGRGHGYQLSQRADYVETEVGLETTLKRPIINTRDEPHADPEKYRRLHVIVGDANLCEVATYLKIGTANLVLGMIEDGWLSQQGVQVAIDGPVAAFRAVSHDITLKQLIRLRGGKQVTALDLQRSYCEQARAWVTDRLGSSADPQTLDVLARWESVLDRLERDPMLCSAELDWVAKLRLLQAYRDRDGLGWDDHRLAAVDLQYSDVRVDKGLYHRLVARGSVERLVTQAEVEAAVTDPPTDTRAYFRGRCVSMYGDSVAAASWDSVILDTGGSSLQRIPTLEPLRGSKAHVGALLDRCPTAKDLVEALAGNR